MIETHDLTRRSGPVKVVDGVTLSVKRGEVLTLAGAPGSGRSEILQVLSGFLKPTAGQALVAGYDVREASREVRRLTGYAPEIPPVDALMTAREDLRFFARLHGLRSRHAEKRIEFVLALVGLRGVERRRLETFGPSERARLAVARALVHDPDVLLLDGPGAFVDNATRRDVLALARALARQDKTVVLTAQAPDEAMHVSHHVALLDRGRLMELRAGGLGERIVDVAVDRVTLRVLEALQRTPGVLRLSRHGEGIRLTCTWPATPRRLREAVELAGARVLDLRLRKPARARAPGEEGETR